MIIGTIPIGVIGLAARHLIAGPLRSLWVVVAALLLWSIVMRIAERTGGRIRTLTDLRLPDVLVIALLQCVALIPGVSRSGATISAGLFRGMDRVSSTRFSFLLSIPALLAAGGFEAATAATSITATIGWGPTLLATAVSLIVGYASIAWLLRLVARHSIGVFVGYRVALAATVAALLLTDVVAATRNPTPKLTPQSVDVRVGSRHDRCNAIAFRRWGSPTQTSAPADNSPYRFSTPCADR